MTKTKEVNDTMSRAELAKQLETQLEELKKVNSQLELLINQLRMDI